MTDDKFLDGKRVLFLAHEYYDYHMASELMSDFWTGGQLGALENTLGRLTQTLLIMQDDIDILKREYEFAKESRAASTAAKDAMFFTDGWEVEYALDIVTSSVAADLAVTNANFNDIDTITALPMDSDEMYIKLEALADSINDGSAPVPSAKKYTRPEYKATYEDKAASGFDESMF